MEQKKKVKAVTQQNGDECNYTVCGVLQVTLLMLLPIYSVVLHIVQERTRGMQYLYKQK